MIGRALGALQDGLRALDPVARAVDRARRRLRAEAGLVRREVTLADGMAVVYLDTETDRPPLVLLHGIGASKDHWPRLARRLAGHVRVIAPDLVGFGESSRPAVGSPGGDYSMAGQAASVVRFLDALGLADVHLGGSSMGGRVAAEVAVAHPERVRTLWLMAPAGAEGTALSELIDLTLAGEPIPLFAQTADEYAASIAFTMRQPPDIPRPAFRVLAAEGAAHHALNLEIFDLISAEYAAGPRLEERIAGLETPTLVTWGTKDRVLHPSGADTLVDVLPDARVQKLPGIGHLPMLEAPEETAAGYLAFLDAATRRPEA